MKLAMKLAIGIIGSAALLAASQEPVRSGCCRLRLLHSVRSGLLLIT